MGFPTKWHVRLAITQISLRIRACAYAQPDQSFRLSLEYSMTLRLLTEHHLEFLSLKGGCTPVKMPHCWRSHVAAQLSLFCLLHYLLHQKHYLMHSTRKERDCRRFYDILIAFCGQRDNFSTPYSKTLHNVTSKTFVTWEWTAWRTKSRRNASFGTHIQVIDTLGTLNKLVQ